MHERLVLGLHQLRVYNTFKASQQSIDISCKSDGLIARENHQKTIQRIMAPYEAWVISIETLANQFTQLLPMERSISVSETQFQHHNKQ